MRSPMFIFASAVSLLVFVLALAASVWCQKGRHMDLSWHDSQGTLYDVLLSGKGLRLARIPIAAPNLGSRIITSIESRGFGFFAYQLETDIPVADIRLKNPTSVSHGRTVLIPLWTPLVVSLILPMVYLARRSRKRARGRGFSIVPSESSHVG